ncbi:MAG: HAD-IC family P-type ATPase [Alphaproteobacteria bacterium]|uniref:HAD-IC family P-type ATPase n=1 Tax=Candidatus Nitrobium versatile TaxID=2884831 RepID=A0A953JEN1_9BACT|nr:HAD-IC family P-type ATPase [Candidatus Nitrobium versatile]
MAGNNGWQGVPWHSLTVEEVLKKIEAKLDGQTDEEARRRRERYGENTLEREEGAGPAQLVLKQLRSPLIYLLAAAAAVSLIMEHYIDAGFIFGVVIINTILGVVQEWRAERALETLHKMAAPRARVVRGGKEQDIEAKAVVPGDILLLIKGDRVAADARLLESDDLKLDESALTGESDPVVKKAEQLEKSKMLSERTNMLWMSTTVTSGSGLAVVVATGMGTEMGSIAEQVQSAEREATPLQHRIGRLGMYIGIAGVILAAGVFGIGVLRGYDLPTMLLFSVAVAVSAIPEGLPAVISITLALGIQRMAKRNAIIRRLPAVETLGSATVICTDKTGTITKNEMTVTRLLAGGRTYSVTGQGYEPEGDISPEAGQDGEKQKISQESLPEALKTLLRIGMLTNSSRLVQEDKEKWIVEGEPTEGALLVVARKVGLDCVQLKESYPKRDEIPFSSELKYMATLHTSPDNVKTVLCVKGAPERIMEFCSRIIEDDRKTMLDEEKKKTIGEINQAFAKLGLRVLAGASRDMPVGQEKIEPSEVERDLTFAGLWGMVDPPRPEAIEAIKTAKEAGIRVVMLTGDNAVTAATIAKKVGIAEDDDEAMTGKQVEEMSKEELADKVMKAGVFARVSPSHKMTIMEVLKENNQIVAMTGDGINDAPALKGADIGIAMGQTGTEVAREAADMILADDNFASIVNAIEEGRIIFGNLRRVVFYLVATSAAEIVALGGALLIGLPLPLTAVMILWINLVTDGPSDVSLGVEPKHRDVLKRPPRPPEAGIFDWPLIRRVLLLSSVVAAGTLGLFTYSLEKGNIAHAQTVAFTTLAAFQWFQAFNSRSQFLSIFAIGITSNQWLLLGVSIAIILQLGVIYSGLGHTIFKTHPLAAADWLVIVPVASTVLIADEIFKLLGVHGKQSSASAERK